MLNRLSSCEVYAFGAQTALYGNLLKIRLSGETNKLCTVSAGNMKLSLQGLPVWVLDIIQTAKRGTWISCAREERLC